MPDIDTPTKNSLDKDYRIRELCCTVAGVFEVLAGGRNSSIAYSPSLGYTVSAELEHGSASCTDTTLVGAVTKLIAIDEKQRADKAQSEAFWNKHTVDEMLEFTKSNVSFSVSFSSVDFAVAVRRNGGTITAEEANKILYKQARVVRTVSAHGNITWYLLPPGTKQA